jgi:hypothetical protein
LVTGEFVSDQVADEAGLGQHHLDGGHAQGVAVADHVIAAAGREHANAVGDGALADKVQDDLGAVAVGQLPNGLRVAAVGDHRVRGAALLGELQRLRGLVHRDDLA